MPKKQLHPTFNSKLVVITDSQAEITGENPTGFSETKIYLLVPKPKKTNQGSQLGHDSVPGHTQILSKTLIRACLLPSDSVQQEPALCELLC